MENKQIAQYVTAEMTRREEAYVAEIIARAESLRDNLDRLITSLKDGDSVSGLGVVQGSGPDLDRLVGELAMIRKVKNDLPSMIEHAEILAAVFGPQNQEGA